jgi:hypothetical protein
MRYSVHIVLELLMGMGPGRGSRQESDSPLNFFGKKLKLKK